MQAPKTPTIQLKLAKSLIGTTEKQRACVKGLGLRKTNSSVTVQNTPENWGMIKKVSFLLSIG